MKLYVVAIDIYADEYGSQIQFYGVYDTEEKAKKRVEELREVMFIPEQYEDKIHEVELNKDCDIYLGGYIE